MKQIWLFLILLHILAACNSTSQDNSKLIHGIPGKETAYPRLSADQQQILYQSNEGGPWSLHILDMQTNTHNPVLADAHNNNFPDWSADQQWIAFTSDRDGNEEIYLMKVDGSGSSHFRCFDLMAEIVSVDISGAGDAEVFASVKLDVDVSGAGSVKYKGNATVSQKVSGSGSVSKVE